jgi:sugar lactone lactonase YvrE
LASAAAIIAAALALSGTGQAQAAGTGFGARPAHGNAAYIVATVAAGASHRSAVVVTSTSRRALHLSVYAVDGETGAASGAVYSTRDRGEHGAARWLSTPVSHIVVRPGREVTIPFGIRVPRNAPPGDHLAGVALEEPAGRASKGRVSVTTVFRQVVGVLVRVPGAAVFQPQLTSAVVHALPNGQAGVRLGLVDAGNLLGKPLLEVTLDGPGGYARTVDRKLDTVLPGDRISYDVAWPESLAPGIYTVSARASGANSTSVLHTSLRVAHRLGPKVVPTVRAAYRTGHTTPWWVWVLAALVALVGALIAVAFSLAVRRGRLRPPTRRERSVGLVALATLVCVSLLFGAAESKASGSLTNISVSLTSGVASASSSYTFSFTTATSDNLTSIKMTVPTGTTGTPTIGSLTFPYGTNPSGGSISLSGNTLTYSFTQFYVASGSNVSIQVNGLTNTATPGSYTSNISTIGPSYNGYPTDDAGTSPSFSISGGALTNPAWSLSNSAASATGVAYTYTFKTATAATLTSVTMSVPNGTGGTPAVGTVSGVPSGGSVSLSGGVLTYSGFSQAVAANTSVSIQITGMTNTSTPGTYTSQLATNSSSGPIDTAVSASISITGGTLGSPVWSVSNSASGATGVAYTYSFTVATAGYLTSFTAIVPNGTGGTPTVGPISSTFNTMPTNGTASLSGTTLSYTFASTYFNAGYTVSIELDGLTNTSTIGSYSSQLTTKNGTTAVDSAVSASIAITGGTLTTPVWSVSNTGKGATGVTYTYTFKTATAASLTSVTMTVPPGTAGTPALGTVSGVPSGGAIALASNTLTYSFSSTAVASGTSVAIHVTGLTNTSTTGSYTSQLTTVASSTPIDTGLTSAVSITGGSLSSPIWSVSASTSGATGVTYSYSFTTGSGSSLSSVTMSVPPGTAGTPTVSSVSGVPSGGTVSLASNTLTYSFTATYLNAGTAVSLDIGGLTNTTTTGTYTSQIATKTSSTPVDTGVTAGVAISGGTLASVGWAVSNAASGATGVTYTYTFTTASTATLASVSMSVPPGTGGTPSLGTVTGLPSSGTVSLSSNTITFSFTGTAVSSGTAVTVHFTGLTNTTTTGSYTSQVATNTATDPVDTGTSGAVGISGGALTSPIWTVSASGSGVSGVTYHYSFTTGSGSNLTSFRMTVPPGTTGTPTVSSVTSTFNSVPTNGTVALASNTLTYTFSAYVNAGTAVTIDIGGMTNTLTPGSYTSNISSRNGSTPIDTGVSAAIGISGGTLASPIWTPSSFATGHASTTYDYTFTTASDSTLDSVTMTVPPGTAGTPTVVSASGVPTGGSVALASNTLTYSFTPTEVTNNQAVEIKLGGLTNTTTTGSYTSQITTMDGESPIDAGITAAVSFGGGNLTSPKWLPSSYAAGTSSTYTYSFTTGSGASLTSITMSVPPGTTGTPSVGSITSTANAVPTNGSVSLASNTLTYSFASTYVNASYAVTIQITGLSNTATAGSYTSQIATKSSTTPVDTGTAPTIAIANGNPYTAWIANSGGGTMMPLHLGSAVAGTATTTGTAPQTVAVAPDGSKAYVVDSTANTIRAVTVSSGAAGTAVSLTGCTTPKGIAISPDGTKAYVTCSGNASVVPVSLPGLSVGSAISVGSTPLGVAFGPNGTTAYVVASGAGTLTPITVSSNAAGSPITLSGCTTPQRIAVIPSGATGYVSCSGNAKVLPVSLPGGSLGSAIGVGTTPGFIAAGPGGTTVFVSNAGSGTVTPITVSSGTAGTALTVGSSPQGLAVSPDGSELYVANSGDATVSEVRLSDFSVLQTFAVGSSPVGVAFVPDQAPAASLTVTPGAAGSATSFDASASTAAFGTITSYAWSFGDGMNATTSSPTTTHTYSAGCSYTVTLTETDSAGTSTTQVFTGQQALRNGGTPAQVSSTVGVTRSLGFATNPSDVSFASALTGIAQTVTNSLALDIGDGTATAGWSVSGTSTTFSTGGGSPHTLPTTSVAVQAAPSVVCDGAASCTPASNGLTYPIVLPAGGTAPPAAKLFQAAAGTGVCDQTVTPSFTLTVPPTAYAGTYSSTWTITISSGP